MVKHHEVGVYQAAAIQWLLLKHNSRFHLLQCH